MTSRPQRLVVVCPVFNEQDNVPYFFSRLRGTFAQVDPSRYECLLLFTDNHSTDGTARAIQAIEAEYPWVYHLRLSRNFGYQLSVLAGLCEVDADLYMVCDVDCEDPPEMLLRFLEQIDRGEDIVYGRRTNRPDTELMRLSRRGFYALLRRLGDFNTIPFMAEFSLFRRAVRDAIVWGTTTFPFLRTEIAYAGFDAMGLDYRREARRFGATHYSYVQSMKFAWAGILASTTFPLRLAMYLVPFVAIVNLAVVALFGTGWLSYQATVTTLLAGNFTYLAIVLAFVSVYLARVYQNGLGRRRFIVDASRSRLPDRLGERSPAEVRRG